jgi:hypothetical protein
MVMQASGIPIDELEMRKDNDTICLFIEDSGFDDDASDTVWV